MLTVSVAEAAAAADTMDSRRNTFTGWLVSVSLCLYRCVSASVCVSLPFSASLSLFVSRSIHFSYVLSLKGNCQHYLSHNFSFISVMA